MTQLARQTTEILVPETDDLLHKTVEVVNKAIDADRAVREMSIRSDEQLVLAELAHESQKARLDYEARRDAQRADAEFRRLALQLAFGVMVLLFALAGASLYFGRFEVFVLMLSHLSVGVGGWGIARTRAERKTEPPDPKL